MADYKERMIRAKKIYDENNPRPELIGTNPTPGEKRIQKQILKKRKRAEDLAKEYFNANKKLFIDDTIEYFIECLVTQKGTHVFEKKYYMKYENYPKELVGYYEEWFLEEFVKVIEENIKEYVPDFCSFNVQVDGDMKKSKKQINFYLFIKNVMWVNN